MEFLESALQKIFQAYLRGVCHAFGSVSREKNIPNRSRTHCSQMRNILKSKLDFLRPFYVSCTVVDGSFREKREINEPRRFPPDKPNNLANRLTLSTRGGTPRYIRTRVKISRRYTAQSSFHPCVSHPYAKRQPWHRRRLFRRWPATSADGPGCCRSAGGPWRARPSGARRFDPTRASTRSHAASGR